MSSSVGGSFGGGGSGTIRYAIIIDDSQVNSKLSSIEQRLNQLDTAARSVGTGLTSLNNGVQILGSTAQNTSTDLDAINNNFQTINSSTQSVGTGLTNLNSNMATLGSTTQGTATDLDAINSNWQSMETGAKNSATSVDALGNAFKQTEGGLNQYNTLSGTVVENTQNLSDATQTTGQKIRQFGGFMKNNALAVGIFTSGVIGLVQSYTQLQKVQLSAQIANTNAEKAQQRVVKAQETLSKAIAKYGEDSKQAQIATKDLALAQETASNKTQQAAIKNTQANESMLQFVSSFTQNAVLVASAGVQMVAGLKDLGPMLKGIGKSFSELGPAVVAFSGPILIAVVGIYALLAALKAVSNVNKIVTKEFGGQAVQMSILEANWLRFKVAVGQATDEEKKRLAQFEKQTNAITLQSKDVQTAIADAFADPIPESFETNMKQAVQNIMNIKPATATAGAGFDTLGQQADEMSMGFQENTVEDQLAYAKFQDAMKQKAAETRDKIAEEDVQAQLDFAKFQDAKKQKYIETQDQINEENVKAQLDFAKFQDAMKQKAIETQDKINEENVQGQLDFAKLQDKNRQAAAKAAQDIKDAYNKTIQDAIEKFQELNDSWNKFKQSSRMDIADKLGLKDVDSRVDKLIKKITQDLPKKIDGIKIKSKINMEIDQKSIGLAAGKILAGLDAEITSSDKVADAVAKSIRDNLPHTDAGDAMKKFLNDAIDRSDTGQYLKDHLTQDMEGNWVLTIPGEVDPNKLEDSAKTAASKMAPLKMSAIIDITGTGDIGKMTSKTRRQWRDENGNIWEQKGDGKPYIVKKGTGLGPTASPPGNRMTGHGDTGAEGLDSYYDWYSTNKWGNNPDNSTQGSTGTRPFNLSQDRSGYANVGAFMDLSRGGINTKNANQVYSSSDPGSLWGMLGGGAKPKPNMFAEINQQFNQLQQDMAGTMNKIEKDFLTVFLEMSKAAKLTIAAINKTWNQLSSNLAGTDNKIESDFLTVSLEMAKSSKFTIAAINKNWNKLQSNMAGTDNKIEQDLLTVFLEMSKATKLTSADINKTWNTLAGKMSSIHLAIAKSWSKMMNQNITNTAAAAKKIESILHSIPDEQVKINIVTTKTTQLKTTRLGKGGIISAAEGYVTNGPELLMVGDNPGGHETIAAIPNNNPTESMRALNRRFGSGNEGSVVNQTINLHISGSEIINERNLSKRIRMEVGMNRDKNL